MIELWEHQKKALNNLTSGSVLVGDTGSGKTLVAIAFYNRVMGDSTESPTLYVITTAKKRDDGDWFREAKRLGVTNLVVDSWNNIKKYRSVGQSMFIFDEQRVVGYGAWTKSFLKITSKNKWILLSATPADTWMDLIPVFIANGFYKNKTQFMREHVRLAPYVTYPKILGFRNERKLRWHRDQIFVIMPYTKTTNAYIHTIPVSHDKDLISEILKTEWNPFTDSPIDSFPEAVAVLRKAINYHPSRALRLVEVHDRVQKLIIFYNLNLELEMLRLWFGPRTTVGEHNGFKHDPLPTGKSWVYLVQYKSGSEAWECFTTNHMAFYSLSYSYREMKQARGRIDRHNTPYTDLHYYELVSTAALDYAVLGALHQKKNFNIKMLKDA